MELNYFQQRAMLTCMDTCENLPYMLLGLQGEVGELSEKFAKAIRAEHIYFSSEDEEIAARNILRLDHSTTKEEHIALFNAVSKELFDVLWFVAGIADVMGWRLDDVAAEGLAKLASRKDRGVIDGDGDER